MVVRPPRSARANRAVRAVVIDQARLAVSASLNCSSISSMAAIACTSLALPDPQGDRGRCPGGCRKDEAFQIDHAGHGETRRGRHEDDGQRTFMPADLFGKVRRGRTGDCQSAASSSRLKLFIGQSCFRHGLCVVEANAGHGDVDFVAARWRVAMPAGNGKVVNSFRDFVIGRSMQLAMREWQTMGNAEHFHGRGPGPSSSRQSKGV